MYLGLDLLPSRTFGPLVRDVMQTKKVKTSETWLMDNSYVTWVFSLAFFGPTSASPSALFPLSFLSPET